MMYSWTPESPLHGQDQTTRGLKWPLSCSTTFIAHNYINSIYIYLHTHSKRGLPIIRTRNVGGGGGATRQVVIALIPKSETIENKSGISRRVGRMSLPRIEFWDRDWNSFSRGGMPLFCPLLEGEVYI